MMVRIIAAFAFVCAASPALAATPPAAGPNMARCPLLPLLAEEDMRRVRPLPTPKPLAGVVRANRDQFGVRTLGGATLCIDNRWILEVRNFALTPDVRFLSFEWGGYESGGYYVVDRAGVGAAFDTGVKPVPSPSRNLLAALEHSESGFGSLNGFAVWRITPAPMREIAKLTLPEGVTDWRMLGWRGESCIPLSAVRFEDLAQDDSEEGKEPRQHFVAVAARGAWRIIKGGKEACPVR